MTGQLQSHGDGGGFIHCTLCGGDAAGPCARCRRPVCGNCCVLTEGTAGRWAICLDCDRRGGRNAQHGWWSLGAWLLIPIGVLAIVLALLMWLVPH
jgi:hypothetical protein